MYQPPASSESEFKPSGGGLAVLIGMLNPFPSRPRHSSLPTRRSVAPPQQFRCYAVAIVPRPIPAIEEPDVSSITSKDIKRAEKCAQGGFGVVLRLNHPKGELALKRLMVTSDEVPKGPGVRRALREAGIWKELQHPNVLQFLGIIETSDDIYLVSPYVKNGSLTDYVRQHPDARRCALLADAADGIAFLHHMGIIHGDIKGSNILVSSGVHPRALLCDFGLSRHFGEVTSAGLQGKGAARWQSPELHLRGAGKTTESDVWAFGMTIYEVLSGNIPYHDYAFSSAVTIALVVRDERPPTQPTQSPTEESYNLVWKVASDCWRTDPAQRLFIGDAHCRLKAYVLGIEVCPPEYVILPTRQ